jgi:hypothetical protein
MTNITEVFPAVGKPTITYIERDHGANEKKLSIGLQNPGQICLVTGPSKTGKTSLYTSILPKIKRQELVIRCSGNLASEDFWANALEDLNFERIAQSSEKWGLGTSTKIGLNGEVGWSWLAKMMATIGFNVSSNSEYTLQRDIVKSKLSAKHLIPLLNELPVQLVVEDFHYLSDDVKREVFQQWKTFIDKGISVVVVSTTHHAIDIARANPDLTGRARFIDVGKWEDDDLAQIPIKGFKFINVKIGEGLCRRIAKESVGLPIITQQICQSIATERDLSPGSHQRGTSVQTGELTKSLEFVCDNLYANHQSDYTRLSTGPRKRSRKHATYEKILASFALDPLQFSLKQHELADRISQLNSEGESPIPAASISAALKALAKFQERNKIALLDWHEIDKTLYILEPSFLFYLRQKLDNASGDVDFLEILKRFLSNMPDIQSGSGQLELRWRNAPPSKTP